MDSPNMTPPKKKRKTTTEYSQSFLPEYVKQYPGIKRSTVSEYNAFCGFCKSDFGIGHSGRYDIERHLKGKRCLERKAALSKIMNIKDAFKKDENNNTDLAVINAEVRQISSIIF